MANDRLAVERIHLVRTREEGACVLIVDAESCLLAIQEMGGKSRRRLCVLAVDDHRANLEALQTTLGGLDCDLVFAETLA